MEKTHVLFFVLIGLILFPSGILTSFSQTPGPYQYRGEHYLDIDYGNGTHKWIVGALPLYIESDLVDERGKPLYQHYIISDEPTYTLIQNAHATFLWDKNTCSAKIYEGKRVYNNTSPTISSDSIVPKYYRDSNPVWQIVDSVNNASCVTEIFQNSTGITVTGTKTSNAGYMKLIYDKYEGQDLKLSMEVKNTSSLTDAHFGFTQTQEINKIIEFAGQQRDLSNYVGQTFDRTFLENNKANLIKFAGDLKFDTIDAWENLESITVNSVNGDLASISFNYLRNSPILLPNQVLKYDPTYTSTNPNEDGYVYSNSATGTACNTTWANIQRTTTNMQISLEDSDISGSCYKSYTEFDISSIDNNAIITDSDFQFYVNSYVAGANRTCEFNDLGNAGTSVTGMTSSQIHTEIEDGTTYATDATCTTATGWHYVDLGSTADTHIKTRLTTNDRFGLGLSYTDLTRVSVSVIRDIIDTEEATNKPQLTITYSLPPSYIVDLLDVYESSSTTLDSGTAVCTDVDLEIASSCATNLKAGHTYRFEIEVDNTGTGAGSPTEFRMSSSVGTNDTLGSITATDVTQSGCSTNTNWTDSILSGTDVKSINGTSCSIAVSGNQEYWFIVTLDTDADDDTSTFYITDGSYSDTSTTTTFTVDQVPDSPSIVISGVSLTQVDITRTAGASNGGATVTNYDLRCEKNNTGGWLTLVSNGTIANYYNYTGLSTGDSVVCQWRDKNNVGYSNWSANATGQTWLLPSGTLTYSLDNVGDVFKISPTINMTDGNPSSFTLDSVKIYLNNTLAKTAVISESIPINSTEIDPIWLLVEEEGTKEFHVIALVSNSPGTSNILSTNVTGSIIYNPSYYIAKDPTQGYVNITVNRDPDTEIRLYMNREMNGDTWQAECLLQTPNEARWGYSGGGTWKNLTGVGYYNQTWDGLSSAQMMYLSCLNDGELFGPYPVWGNGTAVGLGIISLGDSIGDFFGVPLGFFFVLLVAGLASGRTAPQFIIIVLVTAGIMEIIGFFTFGTNVWSVLLIGGTIGIFAGKRFL